ncbi:MAG TPA: FGGY family carbohydrate kinase [Acidimicrobiales bacterium]|nr:FGGY family carbohydrate kinase [Acidimicrobiales bacterium]
MSILVVDVGTSSVRAAVVRPDATVDNVRRIPLPPDVPMPGLVEFDPAAMAAAVLATAGEVLDGAGDVDAVGITSQRASAIAWDAATGEPLGPGLGWQDLRTVGTCLELQAEGIRFSPSESATKFAWLLDQLPPEKRTSVLLGTVDSWIAWTLSGGELHITDASNAAVTGLFNPDGTGWQKDLIERLGIPNTALPRVVDSTGILGTATKLEGAPTICSLIGDQQASLAGQGCTKPGLAKVTFGTGAMLDVCTGASRPSFASRGRGGCFPIIAWQRKAAATWGVEAIMLAAGTAVDWLVEDLGILTSAAESEHVAAQCDDTGGVVAVPALLGYGTPQWDFGARGAVFGLTRGSGRPELVRAVLEGVAHSGADLLESAELDAALTVQRLRVDGGMSANNVFVQALADACDRPVEISRELEATTLGAGLLAGLATGAWSDFDDIASTWNPRAVVEPSGRPANRDRWRSATEKAARWYPELSELRF